MPHFYKLFLINNIIQNCPSKMYHGFLSKILNRFFIKNIVGIPKPILIKEALFTK